MPQYGFRLSGCILSLTFRRRMFEYCLDCFESVAFMSLDSINHVMDHNAGRLDGGMQCQYCP